MVISLSNDRAEARVERSGVGVLVAARRASWMGSYRCSSSSAGGHKGPYPASTPLPPLCEAASSFYLCRSTCQSRHPLLSRPYARLHLHSQKTYLRKPYAIA